jgi:uncharacterized membrane protein
MKVLLCIISYLVLLLGGQLLWKKGIGLLPQAFQGSLLTTVIHLVGSGYIIAGLVAYAIATLVWLYLLSVYDLSYIYPITSLSFVLAVFASVLILGEVVTWNRWVGVVIICFGVYMVSMK